MPSKRFKISAHRRLASIACLIAYLFGAAEVMPELLAFLCSLDSAHTVRLVREESDIRLVLSHENGRKPGRDYRPDQDPGSPHHRHGVLARMVSALSSASDRESDHETCFASTAPSEANDTGPDKVRPCIRHILGFGLGSDDRDGFVCAVKPGFVTPLSIDRLRSLKSTVLVI